MVPKGNVGKIHYECADRRECNAHREKVK